MAKANNKAPAKPVGPTTPPADGKATATGEDGKNYELEKLIVVSTVEGFRRAGRAWSKEATEVAVGELTDEQLEALLAEPNLAVTPVAKAAE